MHALLYLIVSLLAVAVDFFLLGAPFVAALEVIIYAGAIMVLFVFVIMTLNVGAPGTEPAGRRSAGRAWIGPVVLASVLLAEVVYVLVVSAGVRFRRRRSAGRSTARTGSGWNWRRCSYWRGWWGRITSAGAGRAKNAKGRDR